MPTNSIACGGYEETIDAQYDSIPKDVAVANDGFLRYVAFAMMVAVVGRPTSGPTSANQFGLTLRLDIYKFRLMIEMDKIYTLIDDGIQNNAMRATWREFHVPVPPSVFVPPHS